MEIDTRNKNFETNTLIASPNDAKCYFLHLLGKYYYVIFQYVIQGWA